MSFAITPIGASERTLEEVAQKGEGHDVLVSEILSELGLSGSESVIFTTLLKLGTRQASVISKHTGMSRTHVYEVVDRLRHRRLISEHEREGVKYFSPASLEDLMLQLAQREVKLAEQRRKLSEVVQTLRVSQRGFFSDPRTWSSRGAEVRARLFQELTNPDAGHLLVFCSANESLLFEGAAPTVDSIRQLLHLVPTRLYAVLHSSNETTRRLVEELANTCVTSVEEEFPADMIVSHSRITILGQKGLRPFALTVEQPAIAQAILAFGFSLLSRLTNSEIGSWDSLNGRSTGEDSSSAQAA